MHSPAANGGTLEIRVSNAAQNTPDEQKPLKYIMIAGPTASGKSHLAIDLARAIGGEVINADLDAVIFGFINSNGAPNYQRHERYRASSVWSS